MTKRATGRCTALVCAIACLAPIACQKERRPAPPATGATGDATSGQRAEAAAGSALDTTPAGDEGVQPAEPAEPKAPDEADEPSTDLRAVLEHLERAAATGWRYYGESNEETATAWTQTLHFRGDQGAARLRIRLALPAASLEAVDWSQEKLAGETTRRAAASARALPTRKAPIELVSSQLDDDSPAPYLDIGDVTWTPGGACAERLTVAVPRRTPTKASPTEALAGAFDRVVRANALLLQSAIIDDALLLWFAGELRGQALVLFLDPGVDKADWNQIRVPIAAVQWIKSDLPPDGLTPLLAKLRRAKTLAITPEPNDVVTENPPWVIDGEPVYLPDYGPCWTFDGLSITRQ